MKTPQPLFLTLVILQAAVSGCHSPTGPAQFSEVPDYMLGRPKPQAAVAGVVPDHTLSQPKPQAALASIEIVGVQPGMEKSALVKGIRKTMGPASNVYPEPEMMRDAQKLADCAQAGDKVTLHVPRDFAKEMAHKLEEAGLIVRLPE